MNAASNHRYDSVDYGSLDPFLGTMKDFDLLVTEMHKRGMRLIMDGVFNHIGDDSIYFDRYGKYKTVGAYEYWSRIYDLMNTKHMKEDAAKVEAKKQLEAEGQVFSPYHWENWFEIKNQKGTDEMGPKYMYHDWQGYSSLVPFKDADYPGSEAGTKTSDLGDYLLYGKDAVITDEVKYEGLIPGKEYTLHATLMDKKTGEPLKVADKGVTAELKFTPNSQNGTIDIDLGKVDCTVAWPHLPENAHSAREGSDIAIDQIVIGSILGAFQTEDAGHLQLGPSWWINQTPLGIRAQIGYMASLGIIGTAVGFSTDARSALFWPRHEYYRRIFCDALASLVDEGLYPPDKDALGRLIKDVCYENVKSYFHI